MSQEESELLIMTYALRHNLTDIGIEDYLKVTNCHLPYNLYRSKYKFLQAFPNSKHHQYFYCPECFKILDFEEKFAFCDVRHINYKKSKLKKREKYFFHIPLKDQIIEILNSKTFLHFRKNDDTDSDIVNSQVYQKLIRNNFIGHNDITLTFNSDRVSLWNSSNKSMWPILVTINELPYRIRKTNVLLCGLWYGKEKPVMNTSLKPFIEKLSELENVGFQTTTFTNTDMIHVKVHAILCSVDSVARPMIHNVKQFNGKYGCSYCLHKDEQVVSKRGHTRIYCFGE